MTPDEAQLEELAELYGVLTSYEDVRHVKQRASREALVRVLQALGADIKSSQDFAKAIYERRCELAFRGIEPVLVAWDGQPIEFDLTVPAALDSSAQCSLVDEQAEILSWKHDLKLGVNLWLSRENRAHDFITYRLRLPNPIAFGYYELSIRVGDREYRSCVIAAPSRVYAAENANKRIWGGFVPLYAVRSNRNWGAGDFTDLAELAAWMRSRGGRLVGTLPLLAAYLDDPFEPSPYSPVSRLFWNEFYIDVERVPELANCEAARKLLATVDSRHTLDEMRRADHVAYRRLMALKRRVLELLSADFHARKPPRYAAYARYLHDNPQLDTYAKFRAVGEKQHDAWMQWPKSLRSGQIEPRDFELQVAEYHRYVQWLAVEQLERLSKESRAAGDGLYLDLPLGVRQDGFDVWRYQNSFAAASAGCPPDAVFTKGQHWGFAPLHPEGIRETGYKYVREFLANHMRFARTLRIDHVMGLHRLYWIPQGLSAADGAYVRYRADEFYAVLSVESHFNRTTIIGENLGTVPKAVDKALDDHGVRRMYVVQYEYESDSLGPTTAEHPALDCKRRILSPTETSIESVSDAVGEKARIPQNTSPLKPVGAATIASINTHDMPTFAAWWAGDDVPDRVAMGLMTDKEAEAELMQRASIRQRTAEWLRRENWIPATNSDENEPQAVLNGLLRYLAASRAESVLINLEDLWLETRPQNTPGTSTERPNWRRKASRSLEELRDDAGIRELFSEINLLRAARSPAAEPLPAAAKNAKE
jgi:4-alpha-glucanotransferase